MNPKPGDMLHRVVLTSDGEDEWTVEGRTIERETPTYFFLRRPFSFTSTDRIAKNMIGFQVYATPHGALDAFAKEQRQIAEHARQQIARTDRALSFVRRALKTTTTT